MPERSRDGEWFSLNHSRTVAYIPRVSPRGRVCLPFALGALIAPLALPAQLMVSRNVMPLSRDDSAAIGFLPKIDFYGEAQRGFGSAADELAWVVKIGGVLELYRWSRRASLMALVGHELTANPFNSIGFNPRGAIWEEMLLVVQHASAFDWYVGAFHRCRHEIDNSHPPDESDIDPSYVATARLLSLTGVHAGLTSREFSLGSSATLRGFWRGERYATTTDNRTPRNTASPYWKRALGSTGAGARIARPLGSQRELFARGWASLMLFSRGPGRSGVHGAASWRSEVGFRAAGRGGIVDLFAAYERTFDDVTRPTPQRSGVGGVGLRFGAQ
ncbi:MAG: hypothetical protein ACREOG_11600 [Gemmatimonadaceae bacterium]